MTGAVIFPEHFLLYKVRMSSIFTHPNYVKPFKKIPPMKAYLLFCISLFTISEINAQTKGPKTGGGFSNESLPGSNKFWFDVENAEGSDDSYTHFTNLNTGPDSYTDYIHVNKFFLDVPPGKIITGIQVDVERSDPDQNTADYSVKILKYDMVTGNDKSTGDLYPVTDNYRTFGGPGDLWGEIWTPDMINDNGFGIALSAQRVDGTSGITNGKIDNIVITVYYDSPSTLPLSLVNFWAKKNNGSIDITWTTEIESNMSHYEIQRSSDGRSFSTIQSMQSSNRVSRVSYAVTDSKPLNGISYYRLKMVETDGSSNYSRIASVHFASGNSITVYPTLWNKGTILNISNPNNERLSVHFFRSTGQHIGTSATMNSSLPTTTLNNQKGTIYYKIMNANGQQVGVGNLLVN